MMSEHHHTLHDTSGVAGSPATGSVSAALGVTVMHPDCEGRSIRVEMPFPPRVGETVQFGAPEYWGTVRALNWMTPTEIVVRVRS